MGVVGLSSTMDLLSLEDCRKIVDKYFGSGGNQILSYELTSSPEAAAGFIGSSKILIVSVKRNEEILKLNFFTKALPENDYHRKNVEISKVFYKEAEFFESLWPLVSKFFLKKITPACYHVDKDKLLVLENLAASGYVNRTSTKFFDFEHCKTVLTRLASFHAASFLYEKEINATINDRFPHLSCEVVGWFKNEIGHPGYEHCQTGVRALGVVLDCHFAHVSEQVREKVKILLASNPSLLLPSKKYRNALAHSDLWCNNIMFKYNSENQIEDCILLDYQLFGYCPPSVDVYSMIFINTEKSFRDAHLRELLKFYYDEFSSCVQHNGCSADEFLPWKEFNESASEAILVALTNTAIFLHYVLLPEEDLEIVFGDLEETRNFMEVDRSGIVLRALEKNDIYRSRVFAALSDCIDYFENKLNFQ